MEDDLSAMLHKVMPEQEFMSTNDKWLDFHVDYVKNRFADDPTTSLSPFWCFVTANNHMVPIAADFENVNHKYEVLSRIKQLAKALDVKRYVFLTEAWAASLGKDDDITKKLMAGEMQVSQMQSKIEVIIVTAGDKEGNVTKTIQIVRDWTTGHVTELKDYADMPDATGAFTEIFD